MGVELQQDGVWQGWWLVTGVSADLRKYIVYNIPETYRNFCTRGCYVHAKYIDGVSQYMRPGVSVTVSASSPHAVLHLLPSAPDAIIDAAFRALAKDLHPDRGGDPEAFIRLQAAYDQLKRR